MFTSTSCLAMQNQSVHQLGQLVNIYTALYSILGSNHVGLSIIFKAAVIKSLVHCQCMGSF